MFLSFLISIPLLFEGFESGSIPSTWRVGNGGNPNYTWEVMEYGTHWPLEPEPEGNYYVICDSTANVTIFDDTLISPSIPIPSQGLTDLALTFKIFFARDSGSTTRGYVMLKKFVGSSWSAWSIVKTYGEGPDSLIYLGEDSINIYQQVVNAESLKVAFRYYRDDTLYWFILDAIKINAQVSLVGDVGASAIISPKGFFPAGIPKDVKVEVSNYSPNALIFWTKCEIRDSATGVKVYRESTLVSVNANSKDTINLPPFIGSPEKSYHVIGWTKGENDPNPYNDTTYAYATTRPYFGAIIYEFPLPRNDSGFYDLTFNPNDTCIYVIYQKDTVFKLTRTGGVVSNYNLSDFSSGGVIDVPFGIFYDKESNRFWVTQIGVAGASPQWCYAVNYSPTFSFISKFDLKPKGFVVYNLADANGLNKGWVPKAVFPNKYVIYLLNFSDTLNPVLDSISFSYPIFLIAGAIDVIKDTIFLASAFGDNKLFLLDKAGNLLNQCSFETSIKGIAVERIQLEEYVYAYLNIGGYKVVKISTGIKWGYDVKEKNFSYKRKFINSFTFPHLIIYSEKDKEILKIYDALGRILMKQWAKKGVNFINVGKLKPGVYFWKLNEKFKGKFIIKK